jgi:hypothetical protein
MQDDPCLEFLGLCAIGMLISAEPHHELSRRQSRIGRRLAWTQVRWRNSNSGLRASPITRTGDFRSPPTPRRLRVISAKPGTDQAGRWLRRTRAGSKENGAIWLAIAAQREAAYGNPAEARQSAADALKLLFGTEREPPRGCFIPKDLTALCDYICNCLILRRFHPITNSGFTHR